MNLIFNGKLSGDTRNIELLVHSDGTLLVRTTHLNNDIGHSDELPILFHKDAPLEIGNYSSNADELENDLQNDGGFCQETAIKIANYAREYQKHN